MTTSHENRELAQVSNLTATWVTDAIGIFRRILRQRQSNLAANFAQNNTKAVFQFRGFENDLGSRVVWLTEITDQCFERSFAKPTIGGFTLDISSALEVCLKCTWNALVCERIETGLVALDWSYLVATETSKLQRAEVRSQVWSRPYLRVHLSNQNIGS